MTPKKSPEPHVEVEVKYDVPAEMSLPDLLGIDGVAALEEPAEMDLDATYFDSAELRLLQAGTTLRRRKGGVDEGWHLKLSKVEDARIEIHRPLGSGRQVPAQLRQLTRARVRERSLAPVATLRTRRAMTRLLDSTGAVLAEVCDDAVTGIAHGADEASTQWRELEIELVDGDRALLAAVGDRLLGAGASPAMSSSKLARVLRQITTTSAPEPPVPHSAGAAVSTMLWHQTELLLAWDPPLRMDAPDAVRTMRAATRAVRGTLSTYRSLLDAAVTDPICEELRWLGGLLAAVRDADVVAARLKALLAAEPAELVVGPVRRRVAATARSDRRRARTSLLKALDSTRYLRLLDGLDELRAAPPLRGAPSRRPATTVQRRLIRRLWRRVLDRAAVADVADAGPQRDELLHQVRKTIRRTCDALASTPAAPTTLVRNVALLQDVLGEAHDTVLTRAAVHRLSATAAHDGEETFSYGRLHALEQAAGEAAQREYRSALGAVTETGSRWVG